MGHVADHFFLIDVKVQGDPGVLQIVVPRSGVRLIGSELQRSEQQSREKSRPQDPKSTSMLCARRQIHSAFSPVNAMAARVDSNVKLR
jgi:hypothetical protein